MALDPDYVQAVRKLCDEKKTFVLIVDEVQTGAGRTGTFLCCEHYNLKPDVVTMAKGLGGGLPIGAVLMNEKVAGHGPRHPWLHLRRQPGGLRRCQRGGGPHGPELPCQCQRARRPAARGHRKACPMSSISGIGLMVGIEFYDLKAADGLAACREAGLLVLTAKTRLRLLPPLTLSEHDNGHGAGDP